MTTSGCMFALEASSALSDFRAERLLADLKSVYPQVKAVSGRYIHFVHAARALEEQEVSRLRALLSYGFEGADAAADAEFLVIPRLGTISPWASKATDIVHNCGMTEVLRVERGIRYAVAFEGAAPASDILEAIASKLHDRMTESVVPSDFPVEKLFTEHPGKPMSVISASTPEEAHRELARANAEMGLALSDGEMDYLEKAFEAEGRGPTDTELMMFSQANSEHCRHKIFNASWVIDGKPMDQSYLECGLPDDLQASIQEMQKSWAIIDSGSRDPHWDIHWCNLNADINSAEVERIISPEQAWYLREKYLRMERE